MQKGFSAILVIVVVLLLAGGAFGGYYFYNQQKLRSINSFEECAKNFPVMESYPEQCNTPDGKHFTRELSQEEQQKLVPPTAEFENKKMYKDEILGIQFSYPSTWLYQENNNGQWRYIVFGEPTEINHVGQKVAPYPAQFVVLTLYPVKPGQSVEEARNLSKEMTIKWENVKVAGIDAKKVTHMGCISADCIDIIFSNQNMLFDFSIENSSNPDFPKYLKEVTETFKFISDETANWKTYVNTQENYSIKYPASLFTNCGGEKGFFLFEGAEGTRGCDDGEEPTQFYIEKDSSESTYYRQSAYEQCYSVKKEPVSVSGINGYKYYAAVKNRTGECGKTEVAYADMGTNIDLDYKGSSYRIYYFNGVDKSVVDSMLFTFKFLD